MCKSQTALWPVASCGWSAYISTRGLQMYLVWTHYGVILVAALVAVWSLGRNARLLSGEYAPADLRLHDVVNLNCIEQIIFGIESRPTLTDSSLQNKASENKASYRTCLSALPCRRSMEVDTSAAISLLVLLCRRRHCDRNEPQSHADVHRRWARPDLGLPICCPGWSPRQGVLSAAILEHNRSHS